VSGCWRTRGRRSARAAGPPGPRLPGPQAHGPPHRASRRKGEVDGPESPPDRVPARLQQDLAQPLVRRQGYADLLHEDINLKKDLKKRFSHAGSRESRSSARRTSSRSRSSPRGPASSSAARGRRSTSSSRSCRRRPARRSSSTSRRSSARARRPAGLRVGGAAAREAHRFPPRDAQGGRRGAALRRTRHQDPRSGRLNGAEIARSEWYLHGQLPLHTLRADVDYARRGAHHLRQIASSAGSTGRARRHEAHRGLAV